MKTLRQLSCPVCDYSFTANALEGRALGRFRVDVRLCQGRKGLPHISYDELKPSESELIRQRLLAAVQASLAEGIITEQDLGLLAASSRVSRGQIPMAIYVPESESPARQQAPAWI